MPLRNEDLTWQFELRLPGHDQWLPVAADLAGERSGDIAGPIEMPGIWQEAGEAAPAELERALAELAETGDPLGMTGARIVVREGTGTDGEPACILEATAGQLAAGRLQQATSQVEWALREVEIARTQVRAEIIGAAVENQLSRNTIARHVSGALTRRLVLQLLSGYDLVESVRDALHSSWTSRYRRWGHTPEDEYTGPFCYGPVRLDLDPSGQVRLMLVDIDGPDEPDNPLPDEDDEDAERTCRQDRAERARGYAKEVLPLLATAGLSLRNVDGTTASADDLAKTTSGPGLLVSDT